MEINVPGDLFGLMGNLKKYLNQIKEYPFDPKTTPYSKFVMHTHIDCDILESN